MRRLLPLLLLIVALMSSVAWAEKTLNLVGQWQGTLTTPGGKLRIVLQFTRNAQGVYGGTLASPDQGVKEIRLSAISLTDHTLHVSVDSIKGEFNGTIAKDGKSIVGSWQQGATFPLTLTPFSGAITIPPRPQEPKPPFPYIVQQVHFPNPDAPNVTLAGTLTLPRTKGPFTAVELITGSGPQDRNEELFGHKPFLVIADYLTRRGIAVLRVDDRGTGKSTGNFVQATTEDFAGDVMAGVHFLQGRKEINAKRIGLIGHSEGGLIAPMIAVKAPTEIAFIVLLAGPGMPGDQLLLLQSAKISRALGESEQDIAQSTTLMEQLLKIVKEENDTVKADAAMRDVLTKRVAALTEQQRAALGNPETFIQGQITQLTSPWMRFFLRYDPAPILSKVTCPVLALNGELDLQVPYRENIAPILNSLALAVKGSTAVDYTVKALPGLNHLFQTAKNGSPAEYAVITETFSPKALRAMGDWIGTR